MKHKFKNGDIVICHTAEKPSPVCILEIDKKEKLYIVRRETTEQPRSFISFSNEGDWQLYSPESLLEKVIKEMREEISLKSKSNNSNQ